MLPHSRAKLNAILRSLDGAVPGENLEEIRGCIDEIIEAVLHLTADVEDLKTRMATVIELSLIHI